MPVPPVTSEPSRFDQLRTELADLAFELERQGRCDAADVVMQVHVRVRELADGQPAEPAERIIFP